MDPVIATGLSQVLGRRPDPAAVILTFITDAALRTFEPKAWSSLEAGEELDNVNSQPRSTKSL
ncbi:hypothetical protein CCGE532_30635 (plasmid) [Rhizobium sp. CCGE532]|nr:hypothetical protein CCGE532_30635 [Rhizobium sp. CCGE532]